jgi:hypothetical protein
MTAWNLIPIACLLVGCSQDAVDKLSSLPIRKDAHAALSRLRYMRLHNHDRLEPGDLILCGPRDRVVLGFSKQLVVDYLGRDSDWLIPELFTADRGEEVLLTVPPARVMRLRLPRGIGATGRHPSAWVRELAGYPVFTADLRAIALLFDGSEVFAGREDTAGRAEAARREGMPAPTMPVSAWRLGVSTLPRMGPRSGVVIATVVRGSPAERAGLQKGDRILSANGVSIGTFRELKQIIQSSAEPVLVLQVLKKKARTRQELRVELDEG